MSTEGVALGAQVRTARRTRGLSLRGPARVLGVSPATLSQIENGRTAAVGAGLFRADHPHEAARAVVTMCTALPTWWRPDGPLSTEQVAEQYVGFALEVMGGDVRARR